MIFDNSEKLVLEHPDGAIIEFSYKRGCSYYNHRLRYPCTHPDPQNDYSCGYPCEPYWKEKILKGAFGVEEHVAGLSAIAFFMFYCFLVFIVCKFILS